MKVRGRLAYQYGILDQHGNAIDFYLSLARCMAAAKRLLGKALNGQRLGHVPAQRHQADHGKLKQLIRPVNGFKTLKTAYVTIAGFEVMRVRVLRKGQALVFSLTRDICGGARIVERAIGLDASALGEALQLGSARLVLEAVWPGRRSDRALSCIPSADCNGAEP